ncbi:MAG: tetratricopeptide repeat protein [Clostridia bacterium]|nr:tetratricopeptide repeat protein [Clostridia bacterium]
MGISGSGFDKLKRMLALMLAVAILAGIVFANDLSLARTLAAYRDVEEYQYLLSNMDYASDSWLRNLFRQMSVVFTKADTADGQYRCACVRFSRGDMAGALPYLVKAAELVEGGKRAEWMIETGCLAAMCGEAETAHEHVVQAAELAPENADAHWFRYKYAAAVKDLASQAAGMGAYAERKGGEPFLQEAGRLYMLLYDYENAGRFYDMLIENHGGDDERYYLRGSCLMFTGRFEEAIADFKRSSFKGSLYSLGACELSLGHPQSAALYFETSMERNEHVEDSRLMLAACELEVGSPVRAEEMLNTYIENGGAYESACYYRASARALQGNFEGAIEDYDAALLAGTFPEDTLFGAAQCRYFAGRYEEAVDLFLDCIAYDVRPAETRYYLGMTYTEMGESEKARELLRESLAVNSTALDDESEKQTEVGELMIVEEGGSLPQIAQPNVGDEPSADLISESNDGKEAE